MARLRVRACMLAIHLCTPVWTTSELSRDTQLETRRPANTSTGVNPAGDVGDTSQIFWLGGVNGNIPPILLRTFGYSRPISVALRSLSLKPISLGYKTPPIRFSPSNTHRIRWFVQVPPNLELALTPLNTRAVLDAISDMAVSCAVVCNSPPTDRSPTFHH